MDLSGLAENFFRFSCTAWIPQVKTDRRDRIFQQMAEKEGTRMPGEAYCSEKQFRDFWQRYIRKPLGLPAKYKFYSLMDTGVTMMLRANTDILSVRDQARHSSILITDTYTPHDIAKANPLIDQFVCKF
jgi:integrase